jgi:hypothetical protein
MLNTQRSNSLSLFLATLGTFLVTVLCAATASAQSPPTTPWGAPDLQGVWDFRSLTPLERPREFGDKAVLTPAEAQAILASLRPADYVDAPSGIPEQDVERYNDFWLDVGDKFDKELRTSLIVDPPNGRLPARRPAAEAARVAQNNKRRAPVRDILSYSVGPDYLHEDPESLGLSERCLVGFNAGPPIMPSAYNNNLRIVQTPDHVMIMTEMVHDARIIPTDGRPQLPADIRQWYGSSRGYWDGAVLVVETTNFTDKTPGFHLPVVPQAGTINGVLGSGLNLRVEERFSRNVTGDLVYEATIDAADSFEAPFTMRVVMRRSDEKIYEYACHEGNYAMGGILRGARLQESEM